jgi:hypothetical protein
LDLIVPATLIKSFKSTTAFYLDDQLSQITVPILYIGAGGGFGSLGDYTTSLTATAGTDLTTYTVTKQAPNDRAIDYGHAHLWMAVDAANDVWEPLRHWLVNHN